MSTTSTPVESIGTEPPAARDDSDGDRDDSDAGLAPRTRRALTECMTVLPLGDSHYSVTTASGSEYHVDVSQEHCACPDHEQRGARCKHLRRVTIATGERPVSVSELGAVEDPDPWLGEHTDGPVVVGADGGVLSVPSEDPAGYSYHREDPTDVENAARYVRCEACGAECVPADPDVMTHRPGCSQAARE